MSAPLSPERMLASPAPLAAAHPREDAESEAQWLQRLQAAGVVRWITRADARDALRYRRAKQAAEASDAALLVYDLPAAPDGEAYVIARADAADPQRYRLARAVAAAAGQTLRVAAD